MTVALAPNAFFFWVTPQGQPAVGYQLFTYVAGTSIPQATYTDSTQTTQNTNPVVLNAYGYASVWLVSGQTYKLILTDPAGNLVGSQDQIPGGGFIGSANLLPTVTNTYNIGSPALTWANGYFGTAVYIAGVPAVSYPQTAAEIAASVTPVNLLIASHASCGFVIPERYGAVGNGNAADIVNAALDTAAINNSITMSNSTLCPILCSRAYIAIPSTAQIGAANYNCAFALKSGVTFLGQNGGSIKIQNGYSTNSTPLEMAMFSTSAAISNVSWIGLIMDMNGANNLMSPSRPASYNRFNHAAILVNGANGLINDVRIEDCTFKNTAGVCFCVCQLVAAGTTPGLGQRWTIKNNLFLNGGSDTDDHTSVYGWAESVTCDGNFFWEDNPPHTVGLTGGATGFEVHGAHARYVNNYVYHYKLGGYVSSNFTSKTLDVIVANNNFYTSDYGILFYRQQLGGMTEIDDVIIGHNTFYFDTNTTSPLWSDAVATRVCIGFEGQYSTNQLPVNNVKICNNIEWDTTFGSTILSNFVRWDSVTNVAASVCSNISITDNQVIGTTMGVFLITNATNGQGLTEISRNQFISLSPDPGAHTVAGLNINALGGITTLIADGNQFIDERGSPSFARGILLNSGTITDFGYGQQIYKGLTVANYAEIGGITITNRKGKWIACGTTTTVATATAITHSLPATPTFVGLTQQDATPSAVYPSAIGATQFTINFAGGGNHAFSWIASIGSPFP